MLFKFMIWSLIFGISLLAIMGVVWFCIYIYCGRRGAFIKKTDTVISKKQRSNKSIKIKSKRNKKDVIDISEETIDDFTLDNVLIFDKGVKIYYINFNVYEKLKVDVLFRIFDNVVIPKMKDELSDIKYDIVYRKYKKELNSVLLSIDMAKDNKEKLINILAYEKVVKLQIDSFNKIGVKK